ncbi:hypothetical protein BH09PSE2_BH09PSE2_11980 [soil metagenome]
MSGGIGARLGAYLRAIVREELDRSTAQRELPAPVSLQPLEDRLATLESDVRRCLEEMQATHQTIREVRHERTLLEQRLDRAQGESAEALRRLRDQTIAVLGLHTSSVEAAVGRSPETGMGRFASMVDDRLSELANETGKLESAIRFTYEISDRVVSLEEQVRSLDGHSLDLGGRVLEMDAEFRALRTALKAGA